MSITQNFYSVRCSQPKKSSVSTVSVLVKTQFERVCRKWKHIYCTRDSSCVNESGSAYMYLQNTIAISVVLFAIYTLPHKTLPFMASPYTVLGAFSVNSLLGKNLHITHADNIEAFLVMLIYVLEYRMLVKGKSCHTYAMRTCA